MYQKKDNFTGNMLDNMFQNLRIQNSSHILQARELNARLHRLYWHVLQLQLLILYYSHPRTTIG